MAMNRRRFLQTAGVGAGFGMVGGGALAFHDRLHQGLSIQPGPGEIRNMEILGYTQLRMPGDPAGVPGPNGWDRTFEFQVLNGFAYASHGSTGGAGRGGFSIVDVRNPTDMKAIFRHVNDAP